MRGARPPRTALVVVGPSRSFAAAALCVAALCVSSGRHAADAVPYRGPAHRGVDGDKDLDGLGALMALRWGGGGGGGGTVAAAAVATTTTTTVAVATRSAGGGRGDRLWFLNGFFRRGRSKTGSRVALRARDADARADGTTAGGATTGETTTGGAAVTVDPAGRAYATEPECERANSRGPCVCLVPDFLDGLLDDARATGGGGDDDRWTAACPAYQVVPRAFVVTPAARAPVAEVPAAHRGAETASPVAAAWLPVDLDRVVGYRLRGPDDGHNEVIYGLTGTDVKVKCLVNGDDSDKAKSDAFKWDYLKNNHNTNSTVTVTSTGTLLISSLNPADSKNYTCLVPNNNNKKRDTTYVHNVLVEKSLYEVRGRAFYKNSQGGCTGDIIKPFREQLPSLMQGALCQLDEQSKYACNVTIKTLECSEDKVSLEIEYRVTLNDDANFLTLARTTKNGRNALYSQKMLARTSAELVANLKKLLTVQIISEYSVINSLFEPDIGGMRIEQFVTCTPGFGIREIFCAACQVHHFSPNRSTDCVRCPTGYHQPIAGSDKCVKCPNVFVSGCEVIKTLNSSVYLTAIIGLFLLICSLLVASCFYCHREPNVKSTIKKIPRTISNQYSKIKKQYSKLSSSDGGSIREKFEKTKNNFKTRLSKQFKKGYRSVSASLTDDSSRDTADENIQQKSSKSSNSEKKFKTKKFDKLFRKKSNHVIVTPKKPFKTLHGQLDPNNQKHRKPNEQTIAPYQQLDDRE